MNISLVIPCYNHEAYISEAIDSVLTQTKAPYEFLVVNDGSTDHSLDVIKNYPVKVINQVNKGLSSARNTGIMNATGDYIVFFDADDLLLENYIEKVSECIERSNADIVCPSFKCFGKDQNEVILMPKPTLEDFKLANRVGYCSAIRRSCLLECGGYSPRMTWGYEDYALWFDLLSRGFTMTTIPEVLWLYRTKEISMVTEAQKHHEELMNQIKKDFAQIYEEK